MSAARLANFVSEEEYLRLDREAEFRSEFYDGEMVAMAGTSFEHNDITSNLQFELNARLKKTPCRAWSADARTWAPAKRSHLYPDVLVICGEPQTRGNSRDILLNPVVVFEVLSPSTEDNDRGRKQEAYFSIDGLRELILVSQDTMQVEVHRRDETGWSEHQRVLDGALEVQSIDVSLPLVDVYDRVEFD